MNSTPFHASLPHSFREKQNASGTAGSVVLTSCSEAVFPAHKEPTKTAKIAVPFWYCYGKCDIISLHSPPGYPANGAERRRRKKFAGKSPPEGKRDELHGLCMEGTAGNSGAGRIVPGRTDAVRLGHGNAGPSRGSSPHGARCRHAGGGIFRADDRPARARAGVLH